MVTSHRNTTPFLEVRLVLGFCLIFSALHVWIDRRDIGKAASAVFVGDTGGAGGVRLVTPPGSRLLWLIRHPVSTLTGAAKTEAWRPEPGTALPQLSANAVGEKFAIPNVSPGEVSRLPNC
jgi:hypothetical protein